MISVGHKILHNAIPKATNKKYNNEEERGHAARTGCVNEKAENTTTQTSKLNANVAMALG